MSTPMLTSDPAVALELGRRLALNARRPRRPTVASRLLGLTWVHWFRRVPTERKGRWR